MDEGKAFEESLATPSKPERTFYEDSKISLSKPTIAKTKCAPTQTATTPEFFYRPPKPLRIQRARRSQRRSAKLYLNRASENSINQNNACYSLASHAPHPPLLDPVPSLVGKIESQINKWDTGAIEIMLHFYYPQSLGDVKP